MFDHHVNEQSFHVIPQTREREREEEERGRRGGVQKEGEGREETLDNDTRKQRMHGAREYFAGDEPCREEEEEILHLIRG